MRHERNQIETKTCALFYSQDREFIPDYVSLNVTCVTINILHRQGL